MHTIPHYSDEINFLESYTDRGLFCGLHPSSVLQLRIFPWRMIVKYFTRLESVAYRSAAFGALELSRRRMKLSANFKGKITRNRRDESVSRFGDGKISSVKPIEFRHSMDGTERHLVRWNSALSRLASYPSVPPSVIKDGRTSQNSESERRSP